MKKKTIFSCMLIISYLVLYSICAWGYTMPSAWEIKFHNVEKIILPKISWDPSGPSVQFFNNLSDGIEDNWGVAKITSIIDRSNASVVWSDGDNGEHLTAIFWGLDIFQIVALDEDQIGVPGKFKVRTKASSITPEGFSVPDLEGKGLPTAGMSIWLTTNYDITNGPSVRTSANTYPTVTDGVKQVDLVFRSGVLPSSSVCLTSVEQDSLTLPLTGIGSGYADVVPNSGPLAGVLSTKGFTTAFGSRDIWYQFNFRPHPDVFLPDYGWDLNSEDPIIGSASKCSGEIGDFVWHDLNRDGIQQAGEPGILGVTLKLKNSTGTVIATTTTDGNGLYVFKGLCAGDYTVDVDASSLPAGYTPTVSNAAGSTPANDSNGSAAAVNLPTDSSSDMTIDFGYLNPCTARIGDLVWNDKNRNGLQDTGEMGFQGVTVNLKDSLGAVIGSTTTDINGNYFFSGLCSGTYVVEIDNSTLPAGVFATPSLVGSDRSIDSNGSPATVNLPGDDANDMTIDFGYYSSCSGNIGDFVWNDLDRDGIQKSGEPGLKAVEVVLSGTDIYGNTINQTTHTGDAGDYLFKGLCEGQYRVTVSTPEGFTPSPSNAAGSTAATDSNGSPANLYLPGDNASDLTIDFGFNTPCSGTIGNFVWHDLNRNGIQEDNEPGISSVTINLRDKNTLKVLQTTTTGGDGFYLFSGVCLGDYQVEVDTTTLKPEFSPTINNAPGSDISNDSNGSPASVSLPTDKYSDLTIDFGYVTPCTGEIGDFVWHDLDRNGIQDNGEPAIPNVKLVLTYDVTNVFIASTTTNPSGLYKFTGLCAGNYKVTVDQSTLPPGYSATTSNAAGSTTANDSNGSPAPVTLATDNSSDVTIDFGYTTQCAGKIGDFVWNDLNKNGIQDEGEPGIPNVKVVLKNPADNTTINSATTDSNGRYVFEGLCAGEYKVEVNAATLPAGYMATTTNAAGSTPANDSNGSPYTVALGNDATDLTIDFGYYMQTGAGCTLTWGYWKTHSEFGPAPYDATWAKLPNGANSPFFISCLTYYQVLKTEPRGNAYFILAHQFIAAQLNALNGADATMISSQMAAALNFFQTHKPTDKLTTAEKNQVITIAGILDNYNTGGIGPGHCGDTDKPGGCKDHDHDHDHEGNCIVKRVACKDSRHDHNKYGNCVLKWNR